jgi:hypothetical protein
MLGDCSVLSYNLERSVCYNKWLRCVEEQLPEKSKQNLFRTHVNIFQVVESPTTAA